MKSLKTIVLPAFIFILGISVISCKGKNSSGSIADTTINNTQPADTATMQTAPVQISPDDSLTTMANDAVKDYPGITASVNNGEVTLTGDITREKLPKLMMAVNSIHPKKINNNLTIK